MAPNPNGTHMLDYTMLWVDSLARYTRTSGDLSEAYRAYPQVVGFMQHLLELENASSGLLDLPQLHWSQTAYIDPLGFDSRYGQSTALNALYTQALRAAAEIARATGNDQAAAGWELKAEALRQAVNQWLYLPEEGRYLSTIYQGLPVAPGPHAQAYALAYGLPDASQEDAVAQSLLALLSPDPANPNLNIYGFFWVLEGLARSGHTSQALELINLYYGSMIDQGATTWWEQFTAGDNWRSSLSHAWGVSPTWFLSSYVLGATQTGASAWQVRPPLELGALTSAQGAIPIRAFPEQAIPDQDRLLKVFWQKSCSQTMLQVDGPAGAQGEIILPRFQPGASIWVNGGLLLQQGAFPPDISTLPLSQYIHLDAEGSLHLQVMPGPNLIVIEPGC
jgi:alpha-L-rhamnosidase